MAGDCDARMHWVSSGTVSVVSVRSDLTETTHELLGAGDVFGILQGLHRGVNHCFSYRAETKVPAENNNNKVLQQNFNRLLKWNCARINFFLTLHK